MNLTRHPDGRVEMYIHLEKKPDGFAYVDGRICENFKTKPIETAHAVTEQVVVTVTEFVKEIQRRAEEPGAGRFRTARLRHALGRAPVRALSSMRLRCRARRGALPAPGLIRRPGRGQ